MAACSLDQVQFADVQRTAVLAEAAEAQGLSGVDNQPLLAPAPGLVEGFFQPEQVEFAVVRQHGAAREVAGEGSVQVGGGGQGWGHLGARQGIFGAAIAGQARCHR